MNCEYSNWEEWTDCDKPCGGGNQVRRRDVVRHAWYGATKCVDKESREERGCNQDACLGDMLFACFK